MESREGQATRLQSLDTLRGVAILLVFFFHAGVDIFDRALGGAAVSAIANQGVQLFFLVSAYTMCVMWRARANEHRKALKFYIRRVCRIAPLYWFAIAAYALFNGPKPWGDTLANALLVHSWSRTGINSVVPGGWSIGVEIFFYLLFPFVMLVPRVAIMPLAFAWYLVAGVAIEHALGWPSGGFLYYSPLTQLPVFGIGIFLFDMLNRPDRRVAAVGLATAALWLVVAVALKKLGLDSRPFFWIGVTALAIGMAVIVRFSVSVPLVRWMGTISYSMYLSHFAVLAVLAPRLVPLMSGYVVLVVALAVTCAVSWVSFKTAEKWSQELAKWPVRRVDAPVRRVGVDA